MFRGEVFIPIISIVLFLVFLCTDKESKFRKILYSSNVILWGITLFTGLIIEQLPVGYGAVYPNLAFLPLLWFGAFSVGVCTFLYGVPVFLQISMVKNRARAPCIGCVCCDCMGTFYAFRCALCIKRFLIAYKKTVL